MLRLPFRLDRIVVSISLSQSVWIGAGHAEMAAAGHVAQGGKGNAVVQRDDRPVWREGIGILEGHWTNPPLADPSVADDAASIATRLSIGPVIHKVIQTHTTTLKPSP